MVSVIITTYNYGRFLSEAVDSVLNQSYTDLECIVVDNGSTDNTADVISNINDSRVKYLYQENRGVSAGRNTGLKASAGRYIQFLDADDLLEPDKLQASVELLDLEKKFQLVYTDMRYFNDGNSSLQFPDYTADIHAGHWMPYVSGQGKDVAEAILKGNIMVVSSPVFRSEVLETTGIFDESLQANEDWDLWMRFILHGIRIQYLDGKGIRTLVRLHKSSLSRDLFLMQACGLKVLMKNSTQIRGSGLEELYLKRVEEHVHALHETLSSCNRRIYEERLEWLRKAGLYPGAFEPGDWSFFGRLKSKLRRLF